MLLCILVWSPLDEMRTAGTRSHLQPAAMLVVHEHLDGINCMMDFVFTYPVCASRPLPLNFNQHPQQTLSDLTSPLACHTANKATESIYLLLLLQTVIV